MHLKVNFTLFESEFHFKLRVKISEHGELFLELIFHSFYRVGPVGTIQRVSLLKKKKKKLKRNIVMSFHAVSFPIRL